MPVFLSFLLGIFSMGFQLLGSRMLSPWFGSSIIVWAFIISAFLAGFSLGSVLGGLLARWRNPARFRGVALVAGIAVAGFAINALFARGFLSWLDALGVPLTAALLAGCGLLFLPPVCALAAITPVLVQRLCENGAQPGFASGLIYCIGTLGNIVGIMLTAFVLIPTLPVSALLWIWTGGVAAASLALLRCVRS